MPGRLVPQPTDEPIEVAPEMVAAGIAAYRECDRENDPREDIY